MTDLVEDQAVRGSRSSASRRAAWVVRATALVAGLALVAAACSGGDDEAGTTPRPADGADGSESEVDSSSGNAAENGGDVVQLPAPSGDGVAVGGRSEPVDLSSVGRWSDAATWTDGVPAAGDKVTIPAGSRVQLDTDIELSGLTVEGELYFAPDSSATLRSDANVIVSGLLHMQPANPSVEHVIEFFGVDEDSFSGGGMMPIDSDVGLWAVDSGQLLIEGSPRRGWTNVTGDVAKGTTTVEVLDATGWQVGDEISLVPTDRPGPDNIDDDESDLRSGFHESTISAIDGTTVTFADPTAQAHPMIDGRYTAEIMNLTRNVVIRGTTEGQAHVFIHTNEHPHLIRWAAFNKLGIPEAVGRYPLHIHHSGDSVNGSLIEGVVVREGGHHSFVPHESHGLTMRDLVAYQSSGGDAYWWDEGDATHDLLLEHVLAAGVDSTAFYLGRGTNMTIRDAVAVGIENRFTVGGYEWENGAIGSWIVEDVVAHNNLSSGIRVWQNADIPQTIDGFVAYHNHVAAIDHGAYSNRYVYRNGHLFGNLQNGIILHATSASTQIAFENIVIDTGGITEGSPVLMAAANIPASTPTLFRNVEFRGDPTDPIFWFGTATKHQIRCVECAWPTGSDVVNFHDGGPEGTWLEIIDDDQTTRYLPDGSSVAIDPPRPLPVGTGTGLTVEYFANPDLTESVFTTVLPGTTELWELNPDDSRRGDKPYHRLSVEDGWSSRWAGQLEIAASEGDEYTFYTQFNGGLRVWIGDQLLVDDWDNENLNGEFDDPLSAGHNIESIMLSPGRHDIKIEIRSRPEPGSESWGGFFDILWQTDGSEPEVIPASRLYPSTAMPNNEPSVSVISG